MNGASTRKLPGQNLNCPWTATLFPGRRSLILQRCCAESRKTCRGAALALVNENNGWRKRSPSSLFCKVLCTPVHQQQLERVGDLASCERIRRVCGQS